MSSYIRSNKEAWEEAFDQRHPSWGSDVVQRVMAGDYAFFHPDFIQKLKEYDLNGKTIGQFCCNNGRELLSLVKSSQAANGIGFDIAENQVRFAKEKAAELGVDCHFVATNILDIEDTYKESMDLILITIGSLCWFKDLTVFFSVASRCLRENGTILIHEQHPCTNMIAAPGEEDYDEDHPLNCIYSYFEREWTGNDGMYYMTQKVYSSKTFTDYTHSVSDIVDAMCQNHLAVTGMKEFDYDISGLFGAYDRKGFPLSWIVEGKKLQ